MLKCLHPKSKYPNHTVWNHAQNNTQYRFWRTL